MSERVSDNPAAVIASSSPAHRRGIVDQPRSSLEVVLLAPGKLKTVTSHHDPLAPHY